MAAHTVVSIAVLLFQRCIGGLLTQNMHGERSIRRLANSAGFSRLRTGSCRAIGIPPTKSGGGGFLCLGVVRHGPGLPTNMFLNRISRVLAGGGYCRLWGCVKVLAEMACNNGIAVYPKKITAGESVPWLERQRAP